MKKILTIAVLATSLAASAQAVIIGASAGYLLDAKEEYLAARVGTVFRSTDTLAHLGEFEVGFSSQSEGGAKGDFMPVTVNYRAQFAGTGKFGSHVGFGVGTARTKASGFGISDSAWSLAAQGFAGVSYQVSPKGHLSLGVRYVWIDDVRLFDTDIEVGDDTSLEIGFHVNF